MLTLIFHLKNTKHDIDNNSFLTLRPPQGDCEDHATLLCSLLLGFGLDAYVCVGTKAKGTPHTWVLTRGTDGSITFWESLTAHRSNKCVLCNEAAFTAPPVTLESNQNFNYSATRVVRPAWTFKEMQLIVNNKGREINKRYRRIFRFFFLT